MEGGGRHVQPQRWRLTGGLLVDQVLTAGPAPPDDTPGPLAGTFARTVSLPDGETCSYSALVQTTASAEAEAAMVPTLPTLAAVLMALVLIAVAARRLGGRRPDTAR